MHVVLPKAFIIPWKFVSHIPISCVEKDNSTLRCRPFHRSITVLIIIRIISEFASLFVPIFRFLLLYGLWVCGSKFYFSGTPWKRLRKFMHANAVWFAAPSCRNHTRFNSARRHFISQTKKVFSIRRDWSDVMAAVVLCFNDRLRLKCDGTRAETRFLLPVKRASPFKSARASVQSTTGN
jgi:hypothetical protein